MEQLRNINELLFNIKKKLTDSEYIEFNKNLLILYKKQKQIDIQPLIQSQRSLRQYYREQAEQTEDQEEHPDVTNYYNSDTDSDNSDGEVESFYN